nr:MAG TPA: hypothetical protein [Caudoviricetes sp.]
MYFFAFHIHIIYKVTTFSYGLSTNLTSYRFPP